MKNYNTYKIVEQLIFLLCKKIHEYKILINTQGDFFGKALGNTNLFCFDISFGSGSHRLRQKNSRNGKKTYTGINTHAHRSFWSGAANVSYHEKNPPQDQT